MQIAHVVPVLTIMQLAPLIPPKEHTAYEQY